MNVSLLAKENDWIKAHLKPTSDFKSQWTGIDSFAELNMSYFPDINDSYIQAVLYIYDYMMSLTLYTLTP